MCTGVEWIWRCRHCGTVTLKDRGSVRGYTCREAARNRARGVCRTGVEWRRYGKSSGDEVCGLCEVAREIARLTAETCDEAVLTPPEVIFDEDEDEDEDEDDEGGGALLYQGR